MRLLTVLLCLLAPLAALAKPIITDFRLDNGMDVVVIEDHRAAVVTHMVWYRAGAADEPPGKSGIAHYLEHLMFKGTDEIPEGAFSKIIADNGGQDNAFTSLDYTAYFQRIAADRLDLVMKMEADRMRNLRLTDAVALPERDVVLEERNQRTENDPGALFGEQMNAALYFGHPYGTPVIGWKAEMQRMTKDDALAFYRRFYAPDNAILVVAGDVTPEEVRALAEKHYGPLKPSGVGPRRRPVMPPHRAPIRMTMTDDKVRQPYMLRRYIAPSRRTGGDETAAALAMFAEILGGDGVTSRLAKKLQLQDRIAINTGAFYNGGSYDDGSFGVYGVPAPGVPLEKIEAAIDEVIADLAANGPTEEELKRARTEIRASEIYAQDSQSGLARRYGAGLAVGLTVERIRSWPDTLAAVTADDIRAAARKWVRLDHSITGYLMQGEAAK